MKIDGPILSQRSPADLVGREAELARIAEHFADRSGDACLSLLAAPMAGTSELLRQAYDKAFRDGAGPIPFYFEIGSDATARALANRFLREFLLQTVAFRRRDAGIIAAAPDICEITEIAPPGDSVWIDRLAEACEMRLSDDRSFIRNCLSAPVRARRHGAESCVMIDAVHRLAEMPDGKGVLEDLKDIYSRGPVRVIFAGHRRTVFETLPFASMSLEPLAPRDASRLVEQLANRHGVAVTDPSRDLLALELDGLPGHIHRLFAAATDRETDLDTFESVQQIYTDEIFGGRLARCYDRLLDRVLPDAGAQTRVMRVLSEAAAEPDGRVPLAYFEKHTGLGPDSINALHRVEIVDAEPASVRLETSNIVLTDYIRGRARLEAGEPRARVVGESLAAAVKRAPLLMARNYRRAASIGVADLLENFDGQMVSITLFDYARFKAEFKGAGDERIVKALREDNTKAALPRVIYVTAADSLYPNLASIAEPERAAVGIGLEADGREIAVLAAEVDSKLEATRDAAEFWCDRLEAAAAYSDLENFKIWLIAPEGFDAEAMGMLAARGFYGSSRKQAELLAGFLSVESGRVPAPAPRPAPPPAPKPEPPQPVIQRPEPAPQQPQPEPEPATPAPPVEEGPHIPAAPPADEYDMTFPMGADTEIVAARSVEDIARRHGIPQKAINQIKTALVEACINASEHSLSPDKKIDLKFAVEPEQITITVANRGIRLADRQPSAQPDDARRGWGLKLMRSLMDQVRIEPTDDGTRLVMVKTFGR